MRWLMERDGIKCMTDFADVKDEFERQGWKVTDTKAKKESKKESAK